MSTKIELRNITKRFGDVVANDSVDLTVEGGSVHLVLGENGAGKTTLMNILSGLYEPDEGTIHIDGKSVSFKSPNDAAKAGIGMVHQHFMLIDSMTVTENVFLGDEPSKWFGLAIDREAARERVEQVIDAYNFDVNQEARIDEIGVGARQRVEIIKTLYRQADIIILDEPTAVLTPQEVDVLFDAIRELTAEGKTIIFITHKLDEAMAIGDSITVLRDSESVGTVAPVSTTKNELANLMVGRDVLLDIEKNLLQAGPPVLSVRDLSLKKSTEAETNVGFDVCENEILGIVGVEGNGQSEMVDKIAGIKSPDEATIQIKNVDLSTASRRDRFKTGMAHIPEDRQAEGLVMDFDLVNNSIMGKTDTQPLSTRELINWRRVREYTKQIIGDFNVSPQDEKAKAKKLSGGNQQKFIVGREFQREPSLLIAENPTRGVDVGSIEYIHERLLDLRQDGQAILLVTSKLDEALQLADRIAVMYEGELRAFVEPSATDEEELGLLMAGEVPRNLGRVAGTVEE